MGAAVALTYRKDDVGRYAEEVDALVRERQAIDARRQKITNRLRLLRRRIAKARKNGDG